MKNREQGLRERIAADPSDADALRELAELVGSGRGRKEEAVELWLRYVDAADPSEAAGALTALARAQVEARRYAAAIETLKRCTAGAPKCYAAFDLLGELLRQAGRLAEAVEALQHAADLDPKAVQPQLALIACLDALGRHQEAEAALGAVRALGAGDPALTALIQEVARRRE